ncbi:cation-transporting P-type ATPase [Candidatus Binatus sp.]|uniref:cation-translocating P-type ATPase n=1 Tax=Candidatus Binatus sp. TaxID=2811406 RepID=UPI002F92642D
MKGAIKLRAAATDPLSGLSHDEAARRLRKYGPNRLVRASRGAAILALIRTVADPMAVMLAAAGAVYYALGERTDAYVLFAAIVPVLAVDVILEARSRTALKKLAGVVAPRARVVRNGVQTEIPTADLVPGDLLLLKEGDIVHADALVRSGSNLALDESQLTGESEPVSKQPCEISGAIADAPEASRVYAGSRVLEGHGFAEVTATGERTRYGDLARLVAEVGPRPTPLERKTGRMVRWMVGVAITVSALLFVLRMLGGAPAGKAFLYAVSLAMSAVGEEFLLVLTMFLSIGAYRLSQHGVLVRRLASVETLGSTTVICLDKTGTLTAGEFVLEEHLPLGPEMSEEALLEAAALACEPQAADTMERKILAHCTEDGINVDALHSRWRLVHDYPFDPVGKHMSHVWSSREGAGSPQRIVAKGALEGIIEHCDLAQADFARAESANAEMAGRGMRVLAVAGRDAGPGGFTGVRASDERGFRLFGLLGFRDPLRAAVPDAVAQCQGAGVELKLITGDHALTAHAIADAAGIAHNDDGIVTGAQLDSVDQPAFEALVRRCSIFARIRPEQKYAIVEALRRAGEVVAMTGDGINDAPALRRADIGVAMGRRGTEVARAAADIVLLEDDFSAMVATIREGRILLDNIQRAFLYLVGFKVMLVSLTLLAPLFGLPLLLLPVNLVWLEMIVHPVSALAFEGQPAADDVMRRPPRPPASPLVERPAAYRAALSGALLTVMALALFALRLRHGENYARSVAMVVAVVGSLFLVWAEYAGTRRWWRVRAPQQRRFWLVIFAVAVSLPVFMLMPPLATLLMIRPIAPADWAIAISAAAIAVGWRAFGARNSGKPEELLE